MTNKQRLYLKKNIFVSFFKAVFVTLIYCYKMKLISEKGSFEKNKEVYNGKSRVLILVWNVIEKEEWTKKRSD
jgi:hypothetical protein